MTRNATQARTVSRPHNRSVRPSTPRSFRVILAAAAVLSLGGQARAAEWSLADDFSLVSNPNGPWIYQLETTPGDDIEPYSPLTTNTRTAIELWGKVFPTAPIMWSEATGFWGIGRNDTGVTQVSTDSAVTWAPGEVLFHPVPFEGGGSGGRMVITWVAPSDTTITVDWAYGQAATDHGDGVGLDVLLESGATTTVLRSFADPFGASGTFDLLAVSAGDKLHFRYDNWPTAGGDITWAEINISVPTPAALPAGLMLMGAWALRRRGRK